MNSTKTAALVLLLVCAIAAAGYSFYNTYMVKPETNVSAEEREKAMKAVAAFNAAGKQRDQQSSAGKAAK